MNKIMVKWDIMQLLFLIHKNIHMNLDGTSLDGKIFQNHTMSMATDSIYGKEKKSWFT